MKRALLDREFSPSVLTSDFEAHPERTFPFKEITEETAMSIRVDLNGMSELEFFIAETAGVNNIVTFNLSVKFYEETGVEITSSEETVVIPQTTAGQNQYVAITGTTYIQKAAYAIVSFTLPYSADYTVHCFVKGIASSSDSSPQEVIQSDATLLNMTEANSADILAALEAGGGASPLVNQVTHKTPNDGSFAYTSNVTITGSGFPFTLSDANCEIAYILVFPSSGDTVTILNGVNGAKITASANVLTVAGAGTPFAAGDSYYVGVVAQDKAYDAIAQGVKVSVLRPDHLVKSDNADAISETNKVAGTYRYIYVTQGYDNGTISVICSGGVTVDIFGTNNDDADDTADTGWVPLGLTSIIDTTDGFVIVGQEAWKRIMIKVVTSDSSNAYDIDENFGG